MPTPTLRTDWTEAFMPPRGAASAPDGALASAASTADGGTRALTVVVFGATGTLGRAVVAKALAEGHAVRAVSRRPAPADPTQPRLTPVAADALDPEAVAAAVEGSDAVIVALGAGRKGGVRAPGTRNVIAAMKRLGLRRLIVESTLGAGESEANLNFLWRRIMFGLLLRPAFLDHQAQEAAVRESGLDWTVVRPAAFTDGPETGRWRDGFGPEATGLTLKISRADVARFLVERLGPADPRIGQAVGLSY